MPQPNTESEWFDNIEKTVEQIVSDDGYVLQAYRILSGSNNNKWIISIHGYRDRAYGMSDYAYHFHKQGYNVLLPDLEGHGMSEGKNVGMGYEDRFDIIKWINLIIDNNPDAQIALHGVSMGAATVMMTTGEDLPSNVKVAVEDCGYSNIYNQFKFVIKSVLKLPAPNLIIRSANLTTKIRFGKSLKDMNLISLLKKSKTPTLFIHGDKDTFVPFSMLNEVYNANNNIEKEKLVIEGAMHACSSTKNPNLYYSSVFKFIEKYM